MEQKERYLDLPLEDVLGDRFGRYSKYIIQDRALPDARDGLKPVQRRILYAMHMDNNTADKPFRKSAKTVGNVIGNYHPHGDSSVYEAMIRQSQDWKMRHMLVEMHGNNGSVDGDPPAAMRYTEARLSKLAAEMLKNIEKNTVDFMPNFDDSIEEPVVLPGSYPNLLVNGSTGISSGYATDIPPHNLNEVIDAAVYQMDHPDCSVQDLMSFMKGPDFPTGGIIQGIEGLQNAYENGKGKIVLRGKADIETVRGGKERIVITEIPYDVNKANLVKKMDELRIDKKVDGIAEVRDDTDRTGMQIMIELKKDADAQGILHYLYKNTDLQITYHFNMVAIYNKTPKQLNLKQMIASYIEHQKDVFTRRSHYDLTKAKDRAHIVEGLIKAISVLDEVIQTIRSSENKKDAKERLKAQFQFSDQQAEAIVNLQLYRLTNTDVVSLEKEASELNQQIEALEAVLADENLLLKEIKKEVKHVKKTYGEVRRTAIEEEVEDLKINLEVVVPAEDVRVTVTEEGYVKRSSLRSYNASNGGLPGMKESDRLLFSGEMNTTDTLLLFTRKGNYLFTPVHVCPEIRWKDNGQHVGNLISMDPEDRIIQAVPVREFTSSDYITFATKNGMIKRTQLNDYYAQRYSKALQAVKLKSGDEVTGVEKTSGDDNIFLATRNGYGLWFDEEEVSVTGQRTTGVKAINLKEEDCVQSFVVFAKDEYPALFLVTQRGAYKKMPLKAFDKSSRANRGLIMLKELKKKPHKTAAVIKAHPGDRFMLYSSHGAEFEVQADQVRTNDRYTNGSFMYDSDEHGEVVDVRRIAADNHHDEKQTSSEQDSDHTTLF
ncbi:DNA topoisomerase IV subunit A [Salisediminibacterium halotolerans]|uniref:DNA topoisomerase 4 subunit A n=1 Tax=Salisediminibacterium halotolerans TaxID=517425 RepID=A0A1H9RRV8_9BACI|nr:DNA topoisomerase IV subunit A [Salisediminibacterium haloalkalitolerans]SER75691.1 topoisomerase-4 subunit A [Salisediminibacterium haloalkalitolerans]